MGWMHLGPSCYMVSLERMSWYQAQEVITSIFGKKSSSKNLNSFVGDMEATWQKLGLQKRKLLWIKLLFMIFCIGLDLLMLLLRVNCIRLDILHKETIVQVNGSGPSLMSRQSTYTGRQTSLIMPVRVRTVL